jgi:hypothetical protein
MTSAQVKQVQAAVLKTATARERPHGLDLAVSTALSIRCDPAYRPEWSRNVTTVGEGTAGTAADLHGCAVMVGQTGDRAYAGDLRGLQARSDG